MSLASAERVPHLRGWSHAAAALAAPLVLLALLFLANGPAAYAGAAIYGAGLVALFWSSASYHLIWARTRASGVFRRLDHAAIFFFIAATYTPVCLLAAPPGRGIPLLCAAWAVAIAGIALKVSWITMPRWLGVGSYLALGWLALLGAPHLLGESLALPLLLAAGGVVYSAGGVAYAARWPNLLPGWFGYHELFHLAVVAAAALHGAAILALVSGKL